ncbi:MFS transporter [Paucibacter sp. APW11]|uniref:MFS transporter n=1 Tax=Roseateles aquae TaxID=3077235 RepID=A0ABU3PHQ0_9BURK|nr:MFS transporter [Paucibacter sp. APW11]MDT9002089.1 MFS transporter [Paucibacter sp. APW11]
MSAPSASPSASRATPLSLQQRLQRAYRLAVVCLLGFFSGLPLALTAQAMQGWLSAEGLDIATIGFLSLVGMPYTFKFLWAPLMDRFELRWLGRRRAWMVITQLGLAGALWALAATSPAAATRAFALLALLVAFLSASQDVVIDAYRTDLLLPAERGLGASLNVMGYRLAMILSGGIAFIWVDAAQGGGWSWPDVYRLMAALMALGALCSALLLPRLRQAAQPQSVARHDIGGFIAVVAAVALGFVLTDQVIAPAVQALLAPLWAGSSLAATLQRKWTDLLVLLAGIALTLPLAAWAARAARFETLLGGLRDYFSQRGAVALLVFIVFYKLSDAFALSLMTPFLLQAMHFGSAEVGVAQKVFGMWLSIGGALLAGTLMLRIGLWRALMLFGVLQGLGNLGFWWLASVGAGHLGSVTVPAFDWVLVRLAHGVEVDGGLLLVVGIENITSGMGTAAFLALLMSLCTQRFTATQFALLSAFASVGRVWVGPLAGVVAEAIGWPSFFVLAGLLVLPALALLLYLRPSILALEVPAAAAK